MNLFPEYITINNNRISVKKYTGLSHPAQHERELAQFLTEWYNNNDFISTKTSGSTGTPKTIRLKKDFIVQSALRTIKYFNLKPDDRILHCLPVKFIAGKLMVVRALIGNLNLCVAAPDTNFSFLQDEAFRFAAMVPLQVQKILSDENAKGYHLNHIDQLLIGGSSIPHHLEKLLQMLNTSTYSSYAMTETATHIALRKINGPEADSYYHCLDDITVQEANDGCLLIFMPGLANQPLKTTDIAIVKDQKTFKILGRADNIIISGGIKSSPELLEKKLEPYIATPFVITSKPHESLGEQLILLVEGKENNFQRTELRDIIINTLEKYEQPRQIIFIQQLPRSINGKILRKKIRFL